MSDQHNPHFMGCAGHPVVRTPRMDALARQGVLFDSMYCPYPLCVPSRMAFMTGRQCSDVDVYDNGGPLSPNIPTFAHALGAGGYEAVLCGRMHFVGEDQFHGFERRLFGDCQYGDLLTQDILGEGYNRTNGQTRYAVQFSGHGKAGYETYDAMVTDGACEFIAVREEGERPFCLVVGLMLPHNPLICDKALFDHYMDAFGDVAPFEEPDDLHPAIRNWRERRGCGELTDEQIRRGLAAYCGLTEQLDGNVGRVADAVRASASAQDTIVIYCSDHGDMAGEHGMFWKSNFYEGSARVPFIVSWPSGFPQGRRIDAVASLIDVGPTILDMAGAPPLPNAQGRSFLPLLRGEHMPDWPNEVFSECLGFWGDAPSCMLRTGPWKLVHFSETDSCHLFNLDEDPDELIDRANDPACQAVVRGALEKIHSRWSAQAMIENNEKVQGDYRLIRECGHTMVPHPVTHGIGDASPHNAFDASQLDAVFPDRPVF